MGVWRAQFGKRNGVNGAWISKPGIDVTTAQPGQFLLDTSSQVFQCILKGDDLITTEGQATIPAGTVITKAVPLPAAFAGYSNLMMHATYYRILANPVTYYSAPNVLNPYMTYRITSGVLYLNVIFAFAGGTGTPNNSFQHRASYTIFRGQF